MTHILKQKRGVTLVELLAVIVILGIIAAIAVPTIGGLIERQQIKADEATYDSVLEAGRLYAAENPSATTFTLAQVVAAGYISANIFDDVLDSAINFSNTAGVVTITNTGLKINGTPVGTPAP